MTLYLIGDQWVVLEMVLSASERVWCDHRFGFGGRIALAFRDQALEPVLVTDFDPVASVREVSRQKAQAIWDQFLAAWKANVAARQAPLTPQQPSLAPTAASPHP